jgi:hypothetical protein
LATLLWQAKYILASGKDFPRLPSAGKESMESPIQFGMWTMILMTSIVFSIKIHVKNGKPELFMKLAGDQLHIQKDLCYATSFKNLFFHISDLII